MLLIALLVGGRPTGFSTREFPLKLLILIPLLGNICSNPLQMATNEDPQFDQESTCHLLTCNTNTSHPLQLELSQVSNLSTRNLMWQPRHNYSMTHEILESLMSSSNVVIPAEIKDKLIKGVSMWQLALAYHYKHNAHHNYSTTEDKVGQEIALDFFSSALVSCPLAGVNITSGKMKKAAEFIKTWPNYVKSTKQVKDGVELVKNVLFDYYQVKSDTIEEEIPKKPYNSEESRKRYISPELLEGYKAIIGCKTLDNDQILESDLMRKLIYYFVGCVDDELASHTWMYTLMVLFSNSEFGKWITEVYYHKLLVVHFHEIVQSRKVENYVVTNEIALNHDNDKYIPFQTIAYTLKWYYNDEGIYGE